MEGELIQLLENSAFNTLDLSEEKGWKHVELIGMLKSLTADGFALMDQKEKMEYHLTEEGKKTVEKGSPEMILLKILKDSPMEMKEASQKHKIGMGKGMQKKWFKKEGGKLSCNVDPDTTVDVLCEDLKKLTIEKQVLDKKAIEDMKKRGQIEVIKIVYFECKRGPSWAKTRSKAATALTKEMLEKGTWKDTKFKPTNFNSMGTLLNAGYLHPLLQVRTEFRKILIGMGFEEMPTSKWVENSFWNFDALFQPQQHPARDAHDTFFISEPAQSTLETVPDELVDKVKNMHQVGGNGSIGYRYEWSLNESKKNILRTHTTAVSSYMLHKLANQPGGFKPAKYFSIDRVFRNETIDATHLAEFHQVEGLVADYDLSLGDLIGVINTFFQEIGITDIRFKPAYNPYTEPSMEIFGYHPGLKKWTELGNSGMFRPEMLGPLGLPDNVRVIAWGLALERPTMILHKINKISRLFGHKINLEATRTSTLPLLKEHDLAKHKQ